MLPYDTYERGNVQITNTKTSKNKPPLPHSPPPPPPHPKKKNQVFKICLDYWHTLAADLYDSGSLPSPSLPSPHASLNLGGNLRRDQRKQHYEQVLRGARETMISRMAKPEEVSEQEKERKGKGRREGESSNYTLYSSERYFLSPHLLA